MKQTRYRGTEFTKTRRLDCEYSPVKLLANIMVDKPHRLLRVSDSVNFAASFLDICGNPSNYFHKALVLMEISSLLIGRSWLSSVKPYQRFC